MNFLKLSVHVFCLAEKAKLRRKNSRTNCQQNKITICLMGSHDQCSVSVFCSHHFLVYHNYVPTLLTLAHTSPTPPQPTGPGLQKKEK